MELIFITQPNGKTKNPIKVWQIRMLVSKTFVHEEVDGDNKIKSGLGINSARWSKRIWRWLWEVPRAAARQCFHYFSVIFSHFLIKNFYGTRFWWINVDWLFQKVAVVIFLHNNPGTVLVRGFERSEYKMKEPKLSLAPMGFYWIICDDYDKCELSSNLPRVDCVYEFLETSKRSPKWRKECATEPQSWKWLNNYM